MAVEDAGFGPDLGSFQRGRSSFISSPNCETFENPAVVAGVMLQHGAVKFFAAEPRLPPAEEQNGGWRRAKPTIGEHPEHAGPHQGIDVLPAHVAGFCSMTKAGVAVGGANAGFLSERSMSISAGQLGRAGLQGGGAPIETKSMTSRGRNGRNDAATGALVVTGQSGSEFVQQIGLHPDELNDRIAAKTTPIEQERRIMNGRRVHGHRHFVPAGDHLAPVA